MGFPIIQAILLIRHLCRDANIENYQLFETHVLKRSGGNPRAIIEIVERARKEPAITRHFTRNISHPGTMKKIDLSLVFVLIGAVLIASRLNELHFERVFPAQRPTAAVSSHNSRPSI